MYNIFRTLLGGYRSAVIKINAPTYYISVCGGDLLDVFAALSLGAALGCDAAAVSISCALAGQPKLRAVSMYALSFGLFQTVMSVLGWSIGKVGSSAFFKYDHILSFGILLALGIKMLYDSAVSKRDINIKPDNLKQVLLLSLATSIDALASGVTLNVTVNAINAFYMLISVLIIGAVTFVMSFSTFFLCRTFAFLKPCHAELSGGVVLIIIAIKTLLSG